MRPAWVKLVLDLGDEPDQEWLEHHLGERGLSIEDVLLAASALVPRRKGARLYGYGRTGDRPVVVVFSRSSAAGGHGRRGG